MWKDAWIHSSDCDEWNQDKSTTASSVEMVEAKALRRGCELRREGRVRTGRRERRDEEVVGKSRKM